MAKSSFNEKLTAREAKLILMAEGGQITWRELVIQVVWTLALGASLAWAIAVGKATAWHLAVPLAAEYLAILVALPALSIFYQHPELQKERTKCIWLLGGLVAALVITVLMRSNNSGKPIARQISADGESIRNWIVGRQMHWPIMVAVFHSLRNLAKNVRFLVAHGPPFMGPGLGCAMRIVMVVIAVGVLPALGILVFGILEDFGIQLSPTMEWFSPVWIVFGLLLTAELASLWFLWDVQNKLKAEGKLDDLRKGPAGSTD